MEDRVLSSLFYLGRNIILSILLELEKADSYEFFRYLNET